MSGTEAESAGTPGGRGRVRVTLLHTRIRVEERLLLDELERRDVEVRLLHADEAVLDLAGPEPALETDVLLDRCLSHTRALAITRVFEGAGVPCVNEPDVLEACGDKLRTTVRLAAAGVPTPRTLAAFGAEGALAAAERLGYPVVLKPMVGSWGRMVSRLSDRDALEAVLEHKLTLGGVQHGVIYLQEFIRTPGRDIRAFVVDGETICAIGRRSSHWIANTARGATTENVEVTSELNDVCVRAAAAMGGAGAVLAVDLLEHAERGLLVSEVNSTMEFRNSIAPTGVDIPARVIDHVLARAGAGRVQAGCLS